MSSMSSSSDGWTELDVMDLTNTPSNVVMINNTEFATVTGAGDVCKFDIYAKKWSSIGTVKASSDKMILYHQVSFKADSNEIYSFDQANNRLSIINMDSNQIVTINTSVNVEDDPFTIFFNDYKEYHLIGGKNGGHYRWNAEQKQFMDIKSNFNTFFEKSNSECSVFYVSSQNILLLFAGYHYGPAQSLDIMMKYDITDNKWEELKNVKFPHKSYGFGSCMTRDEKYIIVFGGSTGSEGGEEEDIYYLDLSTMQWTKSVITCPVHNDYQAVITPTDDVHIFSKYTMWDDDKQIFPGHWKMRIKDIIPNYGIGLVFGYIRIYWKSYNDQQVFSTDLMKLIYSWY